MVYYHHCAVVTCVCVLHLCVCVCVCAEARLRVLEVMRQCQATPRPELKENGPAYGTYHMYCTCTVHVHVHVHLIHV